MQFDTDVILESILNQTIPFYVARAEQLGHTPPDEATLRRAHPSPLADQIRLLIATASYSLGPRSTDGAQREEVQAALDAILILLFGSPFGPPPVTTYIPTTFWDLPVGQLVGHVQAWLIGDLITITEAARILYPHEQLGARTASDRVRRLLDRGLLQFYGRRTQGRVKQHGKRQGIPSGVSRAEVLALKDRLAHSDSGE